MARFKIVSSRLTDHIKIVDFDVIYLEGSLAIGETFTVYDTHHPIKCEVLDTFFKGNLSTLHCNLSGGLGWEDQFSGAIVDTKAETRPEKFRYDIDPH